LEVDHIYPLSKGGKNTEENLWLICGTCNSAKSNKTDAFDEVTNETVSIFNPRTQNWNEHFSWNKNATKIIGQTSIGRATILALNLNRERFIKIRKHWVSAGWHPPKN
jgi:CRISPR/Cas system Type II protein with McrA/HNH and RuvC-like nuclease domain